MPFAVTFFKAASILEKLPLTHNVEGLNWWNTCRHDMQDLKQKAWCAKRAKGIKGTIGKTKEVCANKVYD